jgi:hypothetical protein
VTTGDVFTATAEAALAVPVLIVTLAPGIDATEDARGAAVTVAGAVGRAVAGTGVQVGRGVGLAVAVAVACPPVSNGVMMPEVAGVAVGGSGVGEGDDEGGAVPLFAVAVGGAVGVTHADAISVAAPAEPVDHPSMMRRIPAVSAAPLLMTSRPCLPLYPSIPLPLVPRRNHSVHLAELRAILSNLPA